MFPLCYSSSLLVKIMIFIQNRLYLLKLNSPQIMEPLRFRHCYYGLIVSLWLHEIAFRLNDNGIRVNTSSIIALQTAFLSTLSKTRVTKHNTGLCNKMLFESNSCVTINIIIIILYSFKNFKYYFIDIR